MRQGPGDQPGPSAERTPEEWAARRAALERKLAARSSERASEAKRIASSGSGMQGMAEGLKLASEFAAGIIVGGAIGYFFDRYAGTSPFGLIIFLMFGFAAGIRNILRSVAPKPVAPVKPHAESDGGRENDVNS
ncbi:AtpZ/AtpI family protein [Fulvimarina sp. 2208YS6-2-32]|uniref:AtpZ/AtpI family protein n=2 Tax=Fulvimarina uroteuthidis TaxID=3098149 RepID=A0ABU5HYS7_9HYPH|nr:AtpZ/AtpI family protein [Fulvimarina sp. 2208YS6-2-32]